MQEWVTPPGVPTGINNAFITSIPRHPFLAFTINHLSDYDLDWISPYATDMYVLFFFSPSIR